MLAVTFVTLLMWISQGFDSTLHWFAYEHNFANPPEDAFGIDYYEGIGIHWSTLATIAFCALQLSLYLKTRLDIDGIINVLYSLLIGWWVAMMVFEVPYVFAMDILHNNNYEALPWNIWLAGYKTIYHGAGGTAGRDAVRWFVIASLLFPTQGIAGYVILVRRYLAGMYTTLGPKFTRTFFYTSTLLVGILVWFVTAQALSPYLFPVIIRNFSWLFGFILSHGLLIYEFERPNRKGNPRAFKYRFGEPVALILFAAMIGGWLLWIYYPGTFPIIKGSLFPQTVYAFYDDTHRVIINQIWIEDTIIHAINVGLKCIVAAWTCYVFAPKLVSTGRVTAGSSETEDLIGSSGTNDLFQPQSMMIQEDVYNPPFFGTPFASQGLKTPQCFNRQRPSIVDAQKGEGGQRLKKEVAKPTNSVSQPSLCETDETIQSPSEKSEKEVNGGLVTAGSSGSSLRVETSRPENRFASQGLNRQRPYKGGKEGLSGYLISG